MKPPSAQRNLPCPERGHYPSRPEARRHDDCPVVRTRCGYAAGRRGARRDGGVAATAEDFGGPFPRTIGRGRRRG